MQPPIASPWGDSGPDSHSESNESEAEFIVPELGDEVRARIRETNYGRDAGWVVELDGEPILVFSDRIFFEMFWDGYNVTLLTQDEAILGRLKSEDLFFESGIVFRNREFPDIPLPHRPLVRLLGERGPVIVRGLYFVIDPPERNAHQHPAHPVWRSLKQWLGLG